VDEPQLTATQTDLSRCKEKGTGCLTEGENGRGQITSNTSSDWISKEGGGNMRNDQTPFLSAKNEGGASEELAMVHLSKRSKETYVGVGPQASSDH